MPSGRVSLTAGEACAMNTDSKKSFLIQAAYYSFIAILAFLAIRFLLPPLSPFILGFFFAWLLHKPAMAISRRLRLHYRLSAFALGLVLYAILLVVVFIASAQVISALEHFVPQIPVIYANQIVPFIADAFDKLEVQMQDFDPAIVDLIERLSKELFTNLQKAISSISVMAVRLASSFIARLPSVILSVILMVVSTFFIVLDFDHIIEYVLNILPKRIREPFTQTVQTGVGSIRKILGAYMLIMCMSFVELSIGLLILNIPYAVGIALLIAVIDIMPVLGTGLVLIPWAIIAAVLGKYRTAIGVALLYVIMLVVRNIVEPKLVGKQMGLHPVATLISMFLGLEMFGILGLFGFPIALSLYFKMRVSQKEQLSRSAQ